MAHAIPCPICDGVGHRVAGTGLRGNVVRLVDCPTCAGFGRILSEPAAPTKHERHAVEVTRAFAEGWDQLPEAFRRFAIRHQSIADVYMVGLSLASEAKARGRLGDNDSKEPRA